MKQKIITLLAISFLAVGLSTTGFNSSLAQDAATQGQAIGTSTNTCPAWVETRLRELQAEYFVLLEQTLESPELTSQQLNYLYQDYLDLKQDMSQVMNVLTVQFRHVTGNLQVKQDCEQKYDFILDQTQEIFAEYTSQVTARKRNFVLNEKYDQITEGLVEMQDLMHSIESNFSTFETQLPCIVEQCIQR